MKSEQHLWLFCPRHCKTPIQAFKHYWQHVSNPQLSKTIQLWLPLDKSEWYTLHYPPFRTLILLSSQIREMCTVLLECIQRESVQVHRKFIGHLNS